MVKELAECRRRYFKANRINGVEGSTKKIKNGNRKGREANRTRNSQENRRNGAKRIIKKVIERTINRIRYIKVNRGDGSKRNGIIKQK